VSEPPGAAARRGLRSLPGALTAGAGVITAVLGVVFLLIPEWRPLPRDKIGASVTIVTLEQSVPLLKWAARQYPTDTKKRLADAIGHEPDANDKTLSGLVVYVKLETDGFKRRSIKLRSRIYAEKTRRPAGNVTISQTFPRGGKLNVDAPSRSSIQLLLLDDIAGALGGPYFVRVEAYDEAGVLAFADSRPFMPPPEE